MKDPKENHPKGSIVKLDGKTYKSLGGGNYEGYTPKKPDYKPQKMKAKTNYKSTGSSKGKPKPKKPSGW